MKKSKLFLCMMLALSLISCSGFLNDALNLSNGGEGETEEGIIWKLDKTTGKLFINGNNSVEEFTGSLLDGLINKSMISDVDLTGFSSICDYAFEGFSGLKSVYIGDELENVGESIFNGLTNEIEIFFPDKQLNLSEDFGLGYKGFGYYINNEMGECHVIGSSVPSSESEIKPWQGFIGKLIIHEGIKSIGKNAFGSWTGSVPYFTDIQLPQTLTSISEYAFGYCRYFDSITIPYSVHSMSYGCFSGLSSSQTIYLDWPSTDTSNRAVNGIVTLWTYGDGTKRYASSTDANCFFSDGVDAIEFYCKKYNRE